MLQESYGVSVIPDGERYDIYLGTEEDGDLAIITLSEDGKEVTITPQDETLEINWLGILQPSLPWSSVPSNNKLCLLPDLEQALEEGDVIKFEVELPGEEEHKVAEITGTGKNRNIIDVWTKEVLFTFDLLNSTTGKIQSAHHPDPAHLISFYFE